MNDNRLLVDYKALKTVFGIPYSRQHLMRLCHSGDFPTPLKLTNHPNGRTAWLVKDVINWLEARQSCQEISNDVS